jgi:hypothetical protein
MSSKQTDAKKPTLRSRSERLITSVLSSEPVPSEECTVCTEPLEEDVVKLMACNHPFHCIYVLAWFKDSHEQRNRPCPVCRTKLYEAKPAGKMAKRPDDSVFGTADKTNRMTHIAGILLKTTVIFVVLAFLLIVQIVWKGECVVHYDIASGSETVVEMRL